MKQSIKKKIVLPLLFLITMPIIILSILSYWNHSKFVHSQEIMYANKELDDLLSLLNIVEKNNETKEFILDYVQSLDKENMFILEGNTFVYNNISDKTIYSDKIIDIIRNAKKPLENYDLHYRVYHQWNWKIGFLMDKNKIPFKSSSLYGYLLLIPLFIFFSLEAIILITDNISKPISILLAGYNDMLSGNFQNNIHIERKDELGLLGKAFNDMKNQIAHRTNKFIQMRNFNEDILRSISTGIITTNVNGKIIKYNQAALDIIEKGMGLKENHPEIIKLLLKQIMSTLKTEEKINRVEVFQSKEEGKNIYLDITTSAMKNINEEKIGVICSFNDISSRKRIEEKIDRVNRLTSLGQLTAALAHEIRNPLSGMKLSVQVLKKRLSKHVSTSDEKLFDATINEIDRLNALITDLLDFSKPNLPKFQVVNVNEVLENALQFSNKIIYQKNISVIKEYDDDLIFVYFDKGQLAQIFLNILANAVQAMDENGNLKINITKDVKYMLLIFEDNGCGIKKENITKIFDPFYTTNESGTGLGLSVVHKLITSNNGEIEVESQVNVGTKIKLYLPLYRRDEREENINH